MFIKEKELIGDFKSKELVDYFENFNLDKENEKNLENIFIDISNCFFTSLVIFFGLFFFVVLMISTLNLNTVSFFSDLNFLIILALKVVLICPFFIIFSSEIGKIFYFLFKKYDKNYKFLKFFPLYKENKKNFIKSEFILKEKIKDKEFFDKMIVSLKRINGIKIENMQGFWRHQKRIENFIKNNDFKSISNNQSLDSVYEIIEEVINIENSISYIERLAKADNVSRRRNRSYRKDETKYIVSYQEPVDIVFKNEVKEKDILELSLKGNNLLTNEERFYKKKSAEEDKERFYNKIL